MIILLYASAFSAVGYTAYQISQLAQKEQASKRVKRQPIRVDRTEQNRRPLP